MKKDSVSSILKRVAKRAGVKVIVEPHYRYAGLILTHAGKKSYFRGTAFDLNSLGASKIAKDKAYCAYFLKRLGYPIIPGEAFYTKDWARTIKSNKTPEAAFKYVRRLGFPVIVKPNSLSQGIGVMKVHDRQEFFEAVKIISKLDRVFLVQKVVTGRDYRIVVLDGKIISAYERLALKVVGDGSSTIRRLIKNKQKLFDFVKRNTRIDQKDLRITNQLRRLGLSMGSVIKKGQEVDLLSNRNLSSGGEAIEMTEKIHPSFRKLCIKITQDLGLRYCGVDLMVKGSLDRPVGKYFVIELNAAPGLGNYANLGVKQKRIVEEMYIKVLKAIAKR